MYSVSYPPKFYIPSSLNNSHKDWHISCLEPHSGFLWKGIRRLCSAIPYVEKLISQLARHFNNYYFTVCVLSHSFLNVCSTWYIWLCYLFAPLHIREDLEWIIVFGCDMDPLLLVLELVCTDVGPSSLYTLLLYFYTAVGFIYTFWYSLLSTSSILE